jgi:hypothetical protein
VVLAEDRQTLPESIAVDGVYDGDMTRTRGNTMKATTDQTEREWKVVGMSADEQGYNGWKNYETWVMALWIDNDQGSYTYARELRDEAHDTGGLRPKSELASMLQNWMEEELDDWSPDSASVFTDLLHAAFGEVDWYEIAENYLSELAEA